MTVIANHQLVPHVTYPGGAEDIQLAREWIYKNVFNAKYGHGSPNKVVLFGHSSGGAHIASNIFGAGRLWRIRACSTMQQLMTMFEGDPERPQRDPLFPPVAGLILLDVPFWYDRNKPVRQKTIRAYYGSDAEKDWGPKSAIGLWERLPADSPVLSVVPISVSIAPGRCRQVLY